MTQRSEPRDQGEHSVIVNGDVIQTPRLTLRRWQVEDAAATLTIFGDVEITRWMTPALDTVATLTDMQALLTRWRTDARLSGSPPRAMGDSRDRNRPACRRCGTPTAPPVQRRPGGGLALGQATLGTRPRD